MIPSIRTFLLVNLLLSVTLITSFAVIGNLFLEHKEVQTHLDEQLVLKGLTIQALMSGYEDDKNLQLVKNKIDQIPDIADKFFQSTPGRFPSYEYVQFQVWNKKEQLILHSTKARDVLPPSLLKNLGLSDAWINDNAWRIFTNYDVQTGITVVVGEQYALRKALETQITRDSLYIMLISYPFLALLIWIIVGRGLDSLKKIAKEVRSRAPSYLEPVDLESVPSEIKPMIDELNELFVKLREAFLREKRFAADAAHELRTPLAALKTQAQVALKAKNEEERNVALRKVITGVDRSAHVVQQLLILSQMVPEAFRGELIPIDLVKQASEIIADLVPEALLKNTEIELIPQGKNLIVMGIPTAISILIRNLVDNAIRYTPPGSTIKVELEETPENVVLSVIDNGPGIPEELHERVFERFFRVLGNKSTGSGLGLGIVQQIAQLHNAKITLETPKTGIGLKISVIFPKAI